ncbi:MAG: hypothetical protein ACREDY_16595, partial [Bradyrhizobium sp.]
MTSEILFEVLRDPTLEACAAVAATAPTNPFYTSAFVSYRQALGEEAYILRLRENEEMVAGCTAFCKSGRLRRSLEVTSLPRLPRADDFFWSGLRRLCKEKRVTELLVCSYASPAAAIPAFEGECSRRPRVEYVLGLIGPNLWKGVRKGHMSNIKKGRKAGLTVRMATDRDACDTHARLIEASMNRRLNRGE